MYFKFPKKKAQGKNKKKKSRFSSVMLHQYLADVCNAKHSRAELSYQWLANERIRFACRWAGITYAREQTWSKVRLGLWVKVIQLFL